VDRSTRRGGGPFKRCCRTAVGRDDIASRARRGPVSHPVRLLRALVDLSWRARAATYHAAGRHGISLVPLLDCSRAPRKTRRVPQNGSVDGRGGLGRSPGTASSTDLHRSPPLPATALMLDLLRRDVTEGLILIASAGPGEPLRGHDRPQRHRCFGEAVRRGRVARRVSNSTKWLATRSKRRPPKAVDLGFRTIPAAAWPRVRQLKGASSAKKTVVELPVSRRKGQAPRRNWTNQPRWLGHGGSRPPRNDEKWASFRSRTSSPPRWTDSRRSATS